MIDIKKNYKIFYGNSTKAISNLRYLGKKYAKPVTVYTRNFRYFL